jgi:multicomponent K+:H+ antiporter subunit A
MITRPLDTIAGELLARSLPEGYGSNVVNVILVDFRGFDTLGEIAVFGIAGLVVHALLRRARLCRTAWCPANRDRCRCPPTSASCCSRWRWRCRYLFLRGHNQPGGGFIAGLVLAIPLLLQYVIQGSQYVESAAGLRLRRCIGMGLLAAPAHRHRQRWLLGYPFLTSGHATRGCRCSAACRWPARWASTSASTWWCSAARC